MHHHTGGQSDGLTVGMEKAMVAIAAAFAPARVAFAETSMHLFSCVSCAVQRKMQSLCVVQSVYLYLCM